MNDTVIDGMSKEDICRRPIRTSSEIFQFLRRHLLHLLIFVPGAFVLVTIHESTHAIMALVHGGIIREFQLLPTRQNFGGSVRFDFPAGLKECVWDVSLAPYIVWLILTLLTTGIAVWRPPKSYLVASCWFVWGFVMPLQDILNAACFWLQGAHNDFFEAFGPTSLMGVLATGALTILCIGWGNRVQCGLYADRKLSLRGWGILSSSTLTGFIVLSLIAFRCTQNR